jgi:hypothetical protein
MSKLRMPMMRMAWCVVPTKRRSHSHGGCCCCCCCCFCLYSVLATGPVQAAGGAPARCCVCLNRLIVVHFGSLDWKSPLRSLFFFQKLRHLTAASCGRRKLNQHFIKMGASSSVAWSLLWAAAPGVSSKGVIGTAKSHGFLGNGFINATEPYSGHYDVPPVVWINAHWHQFAAPGWRFLANATDGGCGWLPAGGSYVTLVPPEASAYPDNTFTLIVETLQGTCGCNSKGTCRCDTNPFTTSQSIDFHLKGPLTHTSTVALWCSGEGDVFVKRTPVAVTGGILRITMEPDTICTATTLLGNGTKGRHPKPPASSRFPKVYSDDFNNYTVDTLARGFSDVYGSFAVRPTVNGAANGALKEQQMALTQVATAKPTGWAPTNLDPLTMIGDSMWTDVSVAVTALINASKGIVDSPSIEPRGTDPPPPPLQPPYVRVCSGGCGDTSGNGLSYGCNDGCCVRVSVGGNWSLCGAKGRAAPAALSGVIAGFTDTWHQIEVAVSGGGTITATINGTKLGSIAGSCVPPAPIVFPGQGMVGLGCGAYHYCQFDAFSIEAK